MSHTIKGKNGTTFIGNSDLSGPIDIINEHGKFIVSGDDLIQLFHYAVDYTDLDIRKGDDVIYITLPRILWKPTDHKCVCGVCKGEPAYWDTLAVSLGAITSTWLVHYPIEKDGK